VNTYILLPTYLWYIVQGSARWVAKGNWRRVHNQVMTHNQYLAVLYLAVLYICEEPNSNSRNKCERCQILCFLGANSYFFVFCHVLFVSLNQHCAISQWCSHVDKHCHHRSHSSWFDFMGCFFSWDCCDSCDLDERWSLLWLILVKIFLSLVAKVFECFHH
jgi:hypothetical protein